MISDLKPYPEYKDSGLAWLRHVPKTWGVARNGSLFGQRNQTGYGELPILEVSLKTGVRVRDFENSSRKQVMSDTGKYKRAAKGDVAYNMMRMWQGAVGVAPVDGLVSPAYVVAQPYPHVEPQFFVALFRTGDYMSEIDNCSRGIVKDRNRLYWGDFKQIPSPCPPPGEQTLIVRFLGWANGRLERAIRAKRKVVALLNEQRQAIIHRAVTQGIDPSVPLKPSGIPWLGDIPQHWEVLRTKFLAHIKTGGRDTVDRIDSATYPFFVRSQTVERIDTYSFDGEAVLTAGDGAGVAKVFHYIDGKFDYHQRVYKFSNFRRISGQFFFLYLKTTLRFEALDASAKSTVDSLRLPLLQNFPAVVPPRDEQLRIVRAVETETNGLDTAISRIAREIEVLREYRTRLVADVVTGKLDVRGAAAQLPDEEAAPEPAEDETDPSLDPEAAEEEAVA